MIHTRLFRRYYGLTTLIVLIFILLGFLTHILLMRYSSTHLNRPHPVLFARMIDSLDPAHRDRALARIMEWDPKSSVSRFEIIDESGEVLYPAGAVFPYRWSEIPKPSGAYESADLEHDPLLTGRPDTLIRFRGEPAQYLYANYDKGRGPFSPQFLSTFGFLIVSVLLGIGFSTMVLFRSLRQTAQLADSVIAELQSGNLKARFPIKKMDEIGQAMSRFNRMADEIERLVERIKRVEQSRMALLQELAHDLRTPVASLRSLIEAGSSRNSAMDGTLREELMSLALKEVDYFERLVEDLLMLAQVTEPRYQAGQDAVVLNDLLDDETESVAAKYGQRLKVRKNIPDAPIEIRGDSHLLRRMVRNALDNAFSFARSEVAVELQPGKSGEAEIVVQDDGAGFTEDALASYGERRVTRVLGSNPSGRLSVGLGSVIIKTVAQLHRGSVTAMNRGTERGNSGARVAIRLPTAIAD